jgi:hypothetical protein
MATLHDKKKGLQENLLAFTQELEAKFPNAVLTSGYRPGAKTNQGKVSRHSHGEAVDFSINPKLASYLESPEGVSLLYKYKLGFLDESKKENKKWGNALHIGQDSALWKQTEAKYNKLFPQQPKEEVTGNVNFFDYIPKSSTFTESIETQEEESEEEIVDPKIKEVEEATNFLNEYEAQTTQDVPNTQYKDKIDLSNIAEANFLDKYDKIGNFLSTPTAQQGNNLTYVNEQENWLNNWVANRKVNNTNLGLKSRVPLSENLNFENLNTDTTQTGKTYGQYDPYDDKITYDINFKEGKSIPTHESTHQLQNYLLGEDKKKYLDYIHNPISKLRGANNNSYLDNPQEVHSRIMSLRKDRGFGPDQTIREEDLKGADLRAYDLDRYDREALINTLNSTVNTYKPTKNNYAQQGIEEHSMYDIKDQRKIRATTNKPINPNKDLVTGKYDKKRIDSVIQAAIRYNQNPYTMVALGLAESGYKEDNIGQILGGATYGDEAGDLVRHYVEKAKGLNEIEGLTKYNGTGKVGGGADGERGNQNKQMYGVPIPKGGLDMGKTKLYSKNVLDLRDNVISKNDEINKAVERYKKEWNPFESEFKNNIHNQTTAEKLIDMSKGLPVNFQQGGGNYTDNEQAFLSELQQGNVVKDNNGYWNPKNWGKIVEISGPNITMQGVNQPLHGYSPETGEKKLMLPGKDYFFKGAKRVIETPLKNKNSKL